MRKTTVFLVGCVCAVAGGHGTLSHGTGVASLEKASARFSLVNVLRGSGNDSLRLLYADASHHVHLYRFTEEGFKQAWQTTDLGSRVTSLLVRDVYADGDDEVVIATAGGRILIYDSATFELLWENLQDPFATIECMTSGNLDSDPQDELVVIADSFLHVYDGLNKTLEWRSQDTYSAREIIIGNVDDDDNLEIILNSGVVIDSRFRTVDFEAESPFGQKIELLDMNGDGIPELIAEQADGTIRVYDLHSERELW